MVPEYNKIINADCFDILPLIPDKSVDMILTDLPYETIQQKWDRQLPLSILFQEYRRIIKDRGVIALFGQGMFTASLMFAGIDIWRYNLIWEKSNVTGFLNAKKMPLRSHEDICIFYKKQPVYNPQMYVGNPNHTRNPNNARKNSCYRNIVDDYQTRTDGVKYPRSILKFNTVPPSLKQHPTEKPVPLLKYLIATYTNRGSVVLDNCCGAGSTPLACLQGGRDFIAIEFEKSYCEIATRRITTEGNS